MKKTSLIVALATTLAAGTAMADTTTTSTQTSSSSAARLLDNISISYLNVFYGPSMTSPFSAFQPNADTGQDDLTAPLNTKNYLSVSYKINERFTVAPVLYFK